MVLDQDNKFFLISLSILITCIDIIGRNYMFNTFGSWRVNMFMLSARKTDSVTAQFYSTDHKINPVELKYLKAFTRTLPLSTSFFLNLICKREIPTSSLVWETVHIGKWHPMEACSCKIKNIVFNLFENKLIL